MIGSDNLKTLSTWEKADELVKKFQVLILERDPDKVEDIIQKNTFLIEHKSSFQKAKNTVRSNLSSTFVRQKLKRGKSIRYLLPDEVYDYIKKHHLFD